MSRYVQVEVQTAWTATTSVPFWLDINDLDWMASVTTSRPLWRRTPSCVEALLPLSSIKEGGFKEGDLPLGTARGP